MEIKDYRVRNQDKYLKDLEFVKKQFEGNDHVHCEFCWIKFSNNKDDLKSGYCSLNDKYWICEECFKEFEKEFNFKIKDFRYYTNEKARDFHKKRRAFIIYKNSLEFLPCQSSMSHFEYCESKGIEKDEFNTLIRGYYLSGNLVFYKANFIYDNNLIKESLNYVNEISRVINQDEFNIYYGQIPEENFKLDLFYGVYKNGVIIKN